MPATPPATADRPAWPDTSRPAELGTASSAFGSGAPVDIGDAPAREPAPSAFDVCHVGVVLRAVVLVQGVVALGTLFAVSDFTGWLLAFSRGSVVSLWSVLLWLALSCLARRRLARLPVPAQWAAAIALGAI
ncbi:MAG TPA: sensor histidine kinase, partial [Burkholderiaceae bacterium]